LTACAERDETARTEKSTTRFVAAPAGRGEETAEEMMKSSSLRLAVPLSLLLLLPQAVRPEEIPEFEWGPVQEYIYAGSRLIAISPPHPRRRRGAYDIALTDATPVVSEGAGRVTITVTLTNPSGEPTTEEVRVKYTTTSGSALAESDFKQTSGALVFPAQSASGTTLVIEVPILDDATSEPEKVFALTLSDPTGAEIVSPASRTIVITDDDPLPAAPIGEPL
jgi:Calx-beta domain